MYYEVTGPFKLLDNCHCSMCRKSHGAAFVTWGIIGSDEFRSHVNPAVHVAALAQVLITLAVFGSGIGGSWSEPLEMVWLNGFFVLLYCGSAWLFWRSGRGTSASR